MKRLSILIVVCIVAFASCKKELMSSGNIIGKWRYTQSYYGTGGPVVYVPANDLHQWILFNSNGSFQSNMLQFKNAISYTLIDSSRVKFSTPSQQPASRLYFYTLDSINNKLSISPADFICNEGCGDDFKR